MSIDSLTGLRWNPRCQSHSPQIGQALLVEIPLHAGQSLIVDIHVAENMRRSARAGIEATFFRSEAYAGKAKGQDVSLLPRRSWRRNHWKPLSILEFLWVSLQSRLDDECEFLHHFVGVDDATGVCIEGDHVQVGSKELAVMIDDVGPGGDCCWDCQASWRQNGSASP